MPRTDLCADTGTFQQRVVTVGSSISAPDIAFDLALAVEDTSQIIHCSIRAERYHPYFGDHAFRHPSIRRHGPISHISSANGERTVHFKDGSVLEDVDVVIFGTGYSWTLPFLPNMEIRNNRVPGLYMHVFPRGEEMRNLVFVGAVSPLCSITLPDLQASRHVSGQERLRLYRWLSPLLTVNLFR